MNNVDQITSTKPERHQKLVSFKSMIQYGPLICVRIDICLQAPYQSFS